MSTEGQLRIALGITIAALFVATILIRGSREKKARNNPVEKDTHPVDILLRAGGVGLLATAILFIAYPPAIRWAELPIPISLRWASVVLLWSVIPLSAWTLSAIDTNVSRTVHTRHSHNLVTTGPYRWIRHPLYAIGTLMWTAIATVTSSAIMFVLIVGLYPLIGSRIRREEANLQERFGEEYDRYRQRTGRILPKIRR